jgi:hypothetical protein
MCSKQQHRQHNSLRRSLLAHPTEFWEPVNQPRSFDTLAKRNRTTLVMERATHRYLKRAQANSRWAGGSKVWRWRTCTRPHEQANGSKRTTRAKITCRTGAPRIVVKRADVHLASQGCPCCIRPQHKHLHVTVDQPHKLWIGWGCPRDDRMFDFPTQLQ